MDAPENGPAGSAAGPGAADLAAVRAELAAVEKGDKLVVGVNELTESLTHELTILRVSHDVERDQVAELAARRATRDSGSPR